VKRAEIEAVREMSRAESEHAALVFAAGHTHRCGCGTCLTFRDALASAMPRILRLLDELVPQPGGR
jgi:hypothetical protein